MRRPCEMREHVQTSSRSARKGRQCTIRRFVFILRIGWTLGRWRVFTVGRGGEGGFKQTPPRSINAFRNERNGLARCVAEATSSGDEASTQFRQAPIVIHFERKRSEKVTVFP